MKIITRTKRVPDEKALYVLDPVTQSNLVEYNHHFILKNGMLKSIDAIDKGEIGSVIESVSQSLINFAKAQTYLAESSEEEAFIRFQSTPTAAERQAFNRMLMENPAKFSFSQQTKTQTRKIPGTNELLYIEIGDNQLPDSRQAKYRHNEIAIDWERFSDVETQCRGIDNEQATTLSFNFPNLKKANIQVTGDIVNLPEQDTHLVDSSIIDKDSNFAIAPIAAGLYTRTLKGFNLTSRIYADLYELRNRRLEKIFDKTSAMRSDLLDLFNQQNLLKSKRKSQCNKQPDAIQEKLRIKIEELSILSLYADEKITKEQIAARLIYLNKQLANFKEKKSRCQQAKIKIENVNRQLQTRCDQISQLMTQLYQVAKWQPKQDFLIGSSEETIQVTSNNAVLVPVMRAAIGKTTNNLKFDNGILISYQKQSPSAAKVISDALVKASNTIYEGVVDIVQIPAKAIGFQLEEVEAKQKLTDSQILLNNKQDRLKGKRFEIQNTLLDAQLEAVIADPGSHMDLLDNSGLGHSENEDNSSENDNSEQDDNPASESPESESDNQPQAPGEQ